PGIRRPAPWVPPLRPGPARRKAREARPPRAQRRMPGQGGRYGRRSPPRVARRSHPVGRAVLKPRRVRRRRRTRGQELLVSFVSVVTFVVDRSQFALTSWTAPALDHLLAVRVVVVGQLLARPDVAGGADTDRAADDLRVA